MYYLFVHFSWISSAIVVQWLLCQNQLAILYSQIMLTPPCPSVTILKAGVVIRRRTMNYCLWHMMNWYCKQLTVTLIQKVTWICSKSLQPCCIHHHMCHQRCRALARPMAAQSKICHQMPILNLGHSVLRLKCQVIWLHVWRSKTRIRNSVVDQLTLVLRRRSRKFPDTNDHRTFELKLNDVAKFRLFCHFEKLHGSLQWSFFVWFFYIRGGICFSLQLLEMMFNLTSRVQKGFKCWFWEYFEPLCLLWSSNFKELCIILAIRCHRNEVNRYCSCNLIFLLFLHLSSSWKVDDEPFVD